MRKCGDNIDSPWLNADQAFEYLAMPSRKALYEAVRRGDIPAYRIGRRLRFHRLELDEFLKNHRLYEPHSFDFASVIS
ncbi:MAG: helix-turn-helix domain-containing protein [Deltaproteobacteria bacterium]|nr:helix-turn-helix domain-containing protein [Deltaproteobacteria bacterium]